MGVGLWFGMKTTRFIFDQACRYGNPGLGDWLKRESLIPFTFNGFPIGDFHDEVVKHTVYEPDWSHEDRWDYTLMLAGLHVALAGDAKGVERSISTLPIGWPSTPCGPVDMDAAVDRILRVARVLCDQREVYGILTHLDLEPEPGCILQRASDVIDLFQRQLLPRGWMHRLGESDILRHLRVCHDICHAAVMFEDQAEVLAKYRAAGIKVGKVQISNAVRADLRYRSARERSEVLSQLRAFHEPRYLHQTMIAEGADRRFFEDLPAALEEYGTTDRAGDEWRVHFHVPVFLHEIGALRTTQDAILSFLRAMRPEDEIHHFEVETYAWDVLPAEVRATLGITGLADGIARELEWVRDVAAREVHA
jgi:hypothetical protein